MPFGWTQPQPPNDFAFRIVLSSDRWPGLFQIGLVAGWASRPKAGRRLFHLRRGKKVQYPTIHDDPVFVTQLHHAHGGVIDQ